MVIIKKMLLLLKKLIILIATLLEKFFLLLDKLIKCFSIFFAKITLKSLVGFLISLFITSWTFWSFYSPYIQIDFSENLKSDNVFTSTFELKNIGNCNIYDVKAIFLLKDLEIYFTDVDRRVKNLNVIFEKPFVYKRIKKGRKQSININLLDLVFAKNANQIKSIKSKVEITITYNYWFFLEASETFIFKTTPVIDDKIKWIYDN
jgi:hypothetical protein